MGGAGAGSASVREGSVLVGKYVLESRLGSGAMGEVWRACNTALGRDVAIKLLRVEHANNAEIVERFLREARTANLVRHPNVVDVLDVGLDDIGGPFLVQELLEGNDLAAHLSELGGRLATAPAMEILLPVVEAVAFAHEKGVVHRDLKPENVFLARTRVGVVPKLLDFGISLVGAEGGSRITTTGVALGTPAYMSPEQIKGAKHVDVRTDVWALGVLIHEMLSGKFPFQAETVADHYVQIATADPTPLEVAAAGAPIALVRIVAKCLRRVPAERYADAGALLVDLRAAAVGEAHPMHAAPPAPRSARDLRVTVDVPGAAGVQYRMPAELELEPIASQPLEVAAMTPPRRVARLHSIGPIRRSDEFDRRRLIASFVATLTALAAAGMLTLVNPWLDQWALAQRTTSMLSGLAPSVAQAVALVTVGIGAAAGVRGWRLEPKSWGHFVATAGALAIAGVIVAASTGQGPWSALPGAAAFGAVGAAAIFLRAAADAWLEEVRGSAVLLAGVATLALFVARQLVEVP
jgi:serine/threonine-protein kinase